MKLLPLASHQAAAVYLAEVDVLSYLPNGHASYFTLLLVKIWISTKVSPPPRLDSLLRLLTPPELRRLKIQLNTSSNDICLELPLELLLCVTQHLDLEEVISLRSVSRKWNETFSSADFCLAGIIKPHFRPVWEKNYRCSDIDQKLPEKKKLMQWLPAAIKDRIRRHHGQYHSMSILPRDGDIALDWMYKNGRIASRVNRSTISVRDIRSNLTARYMDENRLDLGRWHLSEEFLLAAKNGP